MRIIIFCMRTNVALLGFVGMAVASAGCFGGSTPSTTDDGGYGTAADLSPACVGNNDGVIDRSELAFPLGLTVDYLDNPPGTTVTVNPDGTMQPGGRQWDLTSTNGEGLKLTLEPVQGQWFA